LFAGVGNISFELVSRGCPSVTSVDINPKCIDFIKKTAADLKMTEIHTVRADVFDFITRLNTQYDLIFADPPYDNPNLADLPELVLGNNLLAEDGLFVLEHPNKYDFTKRPRCIDHRVYSRVNFSFFK
ncbi:MAG: RsmD family RNA methyltransferase, partial [Bacteroidales bacterium]|nr:RsmD family RNA methyltransferase [Bacteroidales bacterium]